VKLLDRYLLGQFFRNLLLVLCSLIAIYLLVDFFERIDDFLEHHMSMGLAVKYFLLKIPLIIDQIMPVCILLAGVLTLGLLNQSRETIALKAGGISTLRIIRPLALGAVLSTLTLLIFNQWVLPPSLAVTDHIWYEQVQKRVPRGIDRDGRIYYSGTKGIYCFVRPDPRQNRFTDFSYLVWNKNYDVELLLTARTAEWRAGKWTFRNGQLKRKNDDDYSVELFRKISFPLPEKPANFFLPPYKKAEVSLSQLFAKARRTGFAEDGEAWIEFNRRLSYLFLGLPLFLIGLPGLLVFQQKRSRELTLAIPVSCGIAFAAWGWWSAMQSLAASDYLNPVAASWCIHLVVGTAGMIMLVKQNH
jgi:lipopolysaccharide export system permease protein